MINFLKKYLKINLVILKNSYIRDSKIPGLVITNSAIRFLDIVVSLIFFGVIFANTKSLAGWNYYQVIFLYAFIKFLTHFHSAFTKKGVHSMSKELIRKGDFDFYLTKPFDSMTLVAISKPRLYPLLAVFFEIGLMVWSATNAGTHIGPWNIIWFLLLAVFALFLILFLDILSIIPAFWVIRLNAMDSFMDRMVSFARYPSGVFSQTLRFFLSLIFPILVVSYFPARTLFNPPQFSYIIYMIAITVIFGVIVRYLWRLGEKNYGSASS